jgi:hypothetical protein
MLREAIAELKIVCPGHGFSPAEAERIVAEPLVILKKGIHIDSIYIVDRTFTF